VEYGNFKRRDKDPRDRGGDNRDRGSDNRGSGFNRDRGGDFRGSGGGGFNRGGGGDRGGFRERSDFRDRGSEREPEESVFSKRVRAGKRRTYFFDVRKTKGSDFFITITESTRREDGFGYKRHKIFLYKEDFNRFAASLNEVVNHVKTDLMPEFDYEEFDRRQAEWEAQNKEFDGEDDDHHDDRHEDNRDSGPEPEKKPRKDDDEITW
jgi:hypothetical protein